MLKNKRLWCIFFRIGKCRRRKEKKEEKKQLIVGPALRKRSRDEAPFVVPQIFVDYGSRRTSYASASDHVMLGALALDLRRSSGSSCGSRRTSLASGMSVRFYCLLWNCTQTANHFDKRRYNIASASFTLIFFLTKTYKIQILELET